MANFFINQKYFFSPLVLTVSFLLLVSISFAEIENKSDFAPPYDPNVNIVQEEIENWIAREKANASKKDTFVVLKTDVLGRRLSFGTIELLKKSRKVSQSGQKRLVVISDMHLPVQEPIDDIYERHEIDAITGLSRYYVNGKELNEKDYLSHVEKLWEKFNKRKRDKRGLHIPGVISSSAVNWTAWVTAEELSELLDKNKELAVRDYVEPKSTALRETILDLTQLSTQAFYVNVNAKGRGIGIYYAESGCILSGGGVNTSKFSQMNTCIFRSLEKEAHATAVARTLQMASPEAKIYGYFESSYHANPDSYSPPIEIGSQSWSVNGSTNYVDGDFDMDQYVYTNRVIEFAAAGNEGWGSANVTSPGKAVNAITVGAVEPENGYYAGYSSWRNSNVLNEKPEVAAYTNIDFSDNPILRNYFNNGTFNGTSAATPLLAGFTADLLEHRPWFKRRPSALKSLYLTGSTEPINGNHDLDNSKSAKNLIPFSSVAWNTYSIYWEGANSSFFDSNNEITVTDNVDANKRYRIAIAWLTPANYVRQNKRLSQNLNLYVYQNGNLIKSSTSDDNPFELVEFIAPSSGPITIKIRRVRNSIGQGDDIILGLSYWARH